MTPPDSAEGEWDGAPDKSCVFSVAAEEEEEEEEEEDDDDDVEGWAETERDTGGGFIFAM